MLEIHIQYALYCARCGKYLESTLSMTSKDEMIGLVEPHECKGGEADEKVSG